MGYYSDIGLALTGNGIEEFHKRLDSINANSSLKQEVLSFMEYADRHHTDADTKAQVWFWKCRKWHTNYPEYYPEADFIDIFLGNLDENDFYFVRIGEDYDDTEVRGYFWDNPFDLKLTRAISLANPT